VGQIPACGDRALIVSTFALLSSERAGLRWRPLLALSAITLLIQGATLMSLGIFLPAMAGETGGQAGGAATGFLLAMSLANLPAGWALDKIGPRALFAIGIIATAAGCALTATAQQLPMLVVAMAITGAGVAIATVVPGISILTHSHVARRGLALALFLGAAVVSGAVVPPVVALGLGIWPWRFVMMLCGATALACLPLLWLIPPDRIRATGQVPDRGAARAALAKPAVQHLFLATILLQLAINGILLAAVDSLMAQGLPPAAAVAVYSIANLLGLPASLLGGMVADRLGPRPALAETALLLSLGSAALLSIQSTGLAGAAAFALIWGVASALPGQSGSMLLADIVEPSVFPRLLGLNTALSSLIGSLAPFCTDQMRAASGDYVFPVLIYAALALAAAPIVALARHSRSVQR